MKVALLFEMILRISVNSVREFTLFVHFEIQKIPNNIVYLQFKFSPIQDGLWRIGGWQNDTLPPKICHIYPAIMNHGTAIPYLKKIQKTCESCDTPLELWWHKHFFNKNQQFLLYQEIQIYSAYWYIIFSSFTCLVSLQISLIYMVAILMMSVKIATLGLFKIKVFWSKSYDVIIYIHDVTNQILPRDSSCIVDLVISPKFGNFSIYHNLNIIRIWPEKPLFWGVVLLKVQ